ncbi:hypothetical protein R1flu_006477 [Riccia fluitans]|uniref:Uncharacterized protein n=1 Tax=Riccia fluitans TaxID=41844 RepID=A0ABD1YW41_9MARC
MNFGKDTGRLSWYPGMHDSWKTAAEFHMELRCQEKGAFVAGTNSGGFSANGQGQDAGEASIMDRPQREDSGRLRGRSQSKNSSGQMDQIQEADD